MSDDELQAKLDALKQRLESARKPASPADSSHRPMSYGMRIGVDLVSGVLVGTLAGYGLDYWLNTMPWFLLLGMAFGTAAGVRLMMETARKAAAESEREAHEGNGHGR